MCRVLYNAADRTDMWGALTAMPMRQETIFMLLRHELVERDIKPEHILSYEEGHAYSCYVPSLVIRPERRSHVRMLIQSFFDYWCGVYPRVKVESLFAYPTSTEGMAVIYHLFFSPRYDLGVNAFELRPLWPGNPSPLIKSYQRCIRAKEEDLS